ACGQKPEATLHTEETRELNKKTAENACLIVDISEDVNDSVESKHRIGAAWVRPRRCSSQLCARPDAQLLLKLRLPKAEVVKAMPDGCATRTPLENLEHSSTATRQPLAVSTRCTQD
ncbi:unnamed protein product, partial [Sphacelaria rigidula]